MSDEEDNSTQELIREAFTSRWNGIGLTGSLVLLVAGAVSIVQNAYLLSALTWGLGVPLFAVSVIHAWFRKPIRELKEYFDTTAGVFLGTGADQRLARFVIEEQPPLGVVWRLCQPIVQQTLELCQKRPTTSKLILRYKVDVIREDELGPGTQRMHVQWNHSWHALTSAKAVELEHLVLPLFVCEASAREIGGIAELEREGLIDLLWPIPAGWSGDHPISDLTKWPWYSVEKLVVNNTLPLTDCMEDSNKREVIKRVLSQACDKDHQLLPKALNDFLDRCMQVTFVKEDRRAELVLPIEIQKDGRKNHRVMIELQSSYWVWVKGRHDLQVVYRYEVPFDRPAFVASIGFELASVGGKDSGHPQRIPGECWLLNPESIVRSAYKLKADVGPNRQVLEWPIPEEEDPNNTPFLPGHGVTFMWAPREAKKPDASRTEAIAAISATAGR